MTEFQEVARRAKRMREVLFRGKTVCDRWVEGSLIEEIEPLTTMKTYFICRQEVGGSGVLRPSLTYYHVKPATVGQYTGLKDKNGKRIFEGDILKVYDGRAGVVVYDTRNVGYGLKGHGDGCCLCTSEVWEMEVIGNVHDNPELIGGVSDENT